MLMISCPCSACNSRMQHRAVKPSCTPIIYDISGSVRYQVARLHAARGRERPSCMMHMFNETCHVACMHVQRGLQRADATCVQHVIISALAPHGVWLRALCRLSLSLSARERCSVIGDATVLKVPSCMLSSEF